MTRDDCEGDLRRKPRNKPWDILPHEFKNQYRKQARAVLALVLPAIERARVEGLEASRAVS